MAHINLRAPVNMEKEVFLTNIIFVQHKYKAWSNQKKLNIKKYLA
jgi:hypothetical protein